ncbi:c-type cytochrome [Pelagicoccus sp. SDUM812002]|uniref:c-type cytochrome n=1 Tax=Pelagicoccus sp. SDUM812002 TaxID=3041266 RepID=UPI00280FA035|nr:c-type cytochrome [Pelagicoccus sp. SDUM812002]MDQ8186556.1 c-type cytochrome [Pelagicoccus sp. SDUM812002]
MNRLLKIIGAVSLLGALLGGIMVIAGLLPLTASSGHWWITRAALEFGKKRALSTQSHGIQAPDLNDPELIDLGAGAYTLSCMPCHGNLNTGTGGITLGMLPQPPHLSHFIEGYQPPKLFYIIKNGIKLTGMPAWAAQGRDDEVWSIVAYITSLKKTGHGQIEASFPTTPTPPIESKSFPGDVIIDSCMLCHDSSAEQPDNRFIPILAGQSKSYLREALHAYQKRERASGIMQSATVSLDGSTIGKLADYFASLDAPSKIQPDKAPELGQQLALHGDPSRLIPSCIDCHDPEGAERKPEFPLLYGQPETYLKTQLELFRDGVRGGGEAVHLMQEFAHRLTEDDIDALAGYFSKTE